MDNFKAVIKSFKGARLTKRSIIVGCIAAVLALLTYYHIDIAAVSAAITTALAMFGLGDSKFKDYFDEARRGQGSSPKRK